MDQLEVYALVGGDESAAAWWWWAGAGASLVLASVVAVVVSRRGSTQQAGTRTAHPETRRDDIALSTSPSADSTSPHPSTPPRATRPRTRPPTPLSDKTVSKATGKVMSKREYDFAAAPLPRGHLSPYGETPFPWLGKVSSQGLLHHGVTTCDKVTAAYREVDGDIRQFTAWLVKHGVDATNAERAAYAIDDKERNYSG